jgi:hypothetical protein
MIKARRWEGGTISLEPLLNYERTYMGSDGYIYIDVADENPGSLQYSDGTFWTPPHEAMEEFRVYGIDLYRLGREDENAEELITQRGYGCSFYKLNINGNGLDSIYITPTGAVIAIMHEALPKGSLITLKDDRVLTLEKFDSGDYEVFELRVVGFDKYGVLFDVPEEEVDWDKTFGLLETES